MQKPKLIIVTGNPLKFRELSAKLGEHFDCEQQNIEGYEIQGTPKDILMHKMERAYSAFNAPVLVDDTSVHFAGLNGFPGPYIRDFLKVLPSYEMGKKFAGSRIKVVCHLGLMRNKDEIFFGEGIIEGDVVEPKQIDPGIREFDLFIQIDGTDRPMIDFTPEEKNKYSHRGRALDDLISKIAS